MIRKKTSLLFCFLLLSYFTFGQEQNKTKSAYDFSLKELSELNITTGSIKEEHVTEAPSNITIITEQMIKERGYQTLVDVCQDLPGFDFMMYNDGSGEYSTYNMNRGIGDVGNPEILIMIDGIVQNNISFNWSLLWTYENMFIDIERIEIIEGPGSVMYGAQAFTGIIHLITKKDYTGAEVKSFYGSDFTLGTDIHVGAKLENGINLSLAFHKYHSNGDYGIDRYDPGGYFTNNKYPETILADYDEQGNYVQNIPNPMGGKSIPDGFNTENDSYSIRAKISFKNSEIGFFLSDFNRGNSSTYAPYEYNLTGKESTTHYQSYHIYFSNNTQLRPKLNLKSDLVFRGTHILPDGGFRYFYRFPDLTKSYAAYAYQGYIEEKLLFEFNERNVFYIGMKASLSQKSERIVSLGSFSDSRTGTSASWHIAKDEGGLNQTTKIPLFYENELAFYALWDAKWFTNFSSSVGIRYDYSTEFGSVFNPRLALIYNSKPFFGAKVMFGSAFRQPGIFELTNEFRGNPNLIPEKIRTTELELNSLLFKNKISLRANLFYSRVSQFIGKVPDASMPSGERYENLDEIDISGFSFYFSNQMHSNILFYSNYSYLTGVNTDNGDLYEIEHTAKHKVNLGINLKLMKRKLIADFRINVVGKRKAQATNDWLQTYENGYAPSYTKANLTLSYTFTKNFTAQFIANNLFNEQYYGIGRETGSGFIDVYDYQNNINPPGYIPSYHPQPGRTYLVTLTFKL